MSLQNTLKGNDFVPSGNPSITVTGPFKTDNGQLNTIPHGSHNNDQHDVVPFSNLLEPFSEYFHY